MLKNADLLAIADLSTYVIEDWSKGECTPNPEHQSKCTNQTSGDASCCCLADAANMCAEAHDEQWWKFQACMFEHNGSPNAKTGLEKDESFEVTVKGCSSHLKSYSFDDLKKCYTSAEGTSLAYQAAMKSAAKKADHPVWMYVNNKIISGDDYNSADKWAAAVKKALCSAYGGPKPASCGASADILI